MAQWQSPCRGCTGAGLHLQTLANITIQKHNIHKDVLSRRASCKTAHTGFVCIQRRKENTFLWIHRGGVVGQRPGSWVPQRVLGGFPGGHGQGAGPPLSYLYGNVFLSAWSTKTQEQKSEEFPAEALKGQFLDLGGPRVTPTPSPEHLPSPKACPQPSPCFRGWGLSPLLLTLLSPFHLSTRWILLKFWTPVNTVKSPESVLFICRQDRERYP